MRPSNPKETLRTTIDALRSGEIVCVFPEGCLTRNGELNAFNRGIELMARPASVLVVPACIHGHWGTFFSFDNGFMKLSRPLNLRHKVDFMHKEREERASD